MGTVDLQDKGERGSPLGASNALPSGPQGTAPRRRDSWTSTLREFPVPFTPAELDAIDARASLARDDARDRAVEADDARSSVRISYPVIVGQPASAPEQDLRIPPARADRASADRLARASAFGRLALLLPPGAALAADDVELSIEVDVPAGDVGAAPEAFDAAATYAPSDRDEAAVDEVAVDEVAVDEALLDEAAIEVPTRDEGAADQSGIDQTEADAPDVDATAADTHDHSDASDGGTGAPAVDTVAARAAAGAFEGHAAASVLARAPAAIEDGRVAPRSRRRQVVLRAPAARPAHLARARLLFLAYNGVLLAALAVVVGLFWFDPWARRAAAARPVIRRVGGLVVTGLLPPPPKPASTVRVFVDTSTPPWTILPAYPVNAGPARTEAE